MQSAYESITQYVNHDGYGMGGHISNKYSDTAYDKWYEYDISGMSGDFLILVQEASSNYANRRKYNLRWRFGTGM